MHLCCLKKREKERKNNAAFVALRVGFMNDKLYLMKLYLLSVPEQFCLPPGFNQRFGKAVSALLLYN